MTQHSLEASSSTTIGHSGGSTSLATDALIPRRAKRGLRLEVAVAASDSCRLGHLGGRTYLVRVRDTIHRRWVLSFPNVPLLVPRRCRGKPRLASRRSRGAGRAAATLRRARRSRWPWPARGRARRPWGF